MHTLLPHPWSLHTCGTANSSKAAGVASLKGTMPSRPSASGACFRCMQEKGWLFKSLLAVQCGLPVKASPAAQLLGACRARQYQCSLHMSQARERCHAALPKVKVNLRAERPERSRAQMWRACSAAAACCCSTWALRTAFICWPPGWQSGASIYRFFHAKSAKLSSESMLVGCDPLSVYGLPVLIYICATRCGQHASLLVQSK